MGYRLLRIPVGLAAAALLTTFVIGSSARPAGPAGPAGRPDVQPAFRIVTPEVSDVITQDITPEIALALNRSQPGGVVVSDVMCSPLRPGDVILSINGNPVRCQQELNAQLAQLRSGQTFFVEICRDGQILTVTIQRPLETVSLQDLKTIRGITVASLPTEEGVVVAKVQIATPASDIGLKPGDILLEVDGHPIRSASEFVGLVSQLGDRAATFAVLQRNGQVNVFVITA